MTRTIGILLTIAALALTACQRDETGGPFDIGARVFVFNYRLSYANYMLAFVRSDPTVEVANVTATFENPAGGEAFVVQQAVSPEQVKISLESPHVRCIQKGRAYAVTVRFFGPDGTLIQNVETTVTSDVDQSVLAAQPLVVGPAYDKNPAVFKPGATPDFAADAKCP